MSQTPRAPRAALIVAATLLAACSDASTSSLAGGTTVSTTVPTTCRAAQTLAVGQVVTGLTGSSGCIGGVSAAAEYALVAFNGSTWHDLANSTSTGIANLQNVFGTGIINLLRDWGTSVIADDVSGSGAQYQLPSWNFRSIFAVLENSSVFPLATVSLASSAKTVSLVRGANAYPRFAVAAGGSGTVTWTSAPSSVQFSLVRLK